MLRRVMKNTFAVILIASAAIGFWSPFASAQGNTAVSGADFTVGLVKGSPLAFGGAYRALANDNSAIVLNPAGIMRPQPFSASFDWVTSDFQKIDVLSGAVIDSNPESGYALAFSFDRITQEILGNDVDYTQYTLAVAGNLIPMLNLGLSGKYYQSSVQSPIISGPDSFTADIGSQLFISEAVTLALTLQNIVEGTGDPNVPMLLSGGLAVRPDARSVLLMDIVHDFSTPNNNATNFHFGGQYQISPDFLFRSGFGWDRVRDNPFLGVGLLVAASRARLGFTYTRRFDTSDNTYSAFLEVKF